MGTQGSTLSRQKPQVVHEKKADISKDYISSYEKFRNSPSYLKELLSENAQFTNNLLNFFPQADKSYEAYVEMVGYLRKYEPSISHNAIAKYNVQKTTLLDRFLMICLQKKTFEQFEEEEMSLDQLEELFKHYMKLFIKNPQNGFIDKLLKFIHLDGKQKISLKQFSAQIRQFLPHAQKHLKDYYTAKFRDCIPDFHILKNFDSAILKEDAVILSMKVDQLAGKEIIQLYTSETGGLGFHSIERKLLGYTGHWLLLVQHSQKNSDNEKVTYKFGTFQSGPIREASAFQGSVEAFMFSIEPKIRFMTTDKGDGGNHYFYINNIDEKLSKKRRGFGFGGNKNKEQFKLWLDEDLERSTVFNGNDPTYGFGTLASSATDMLSIRKLEIWGLGDKHNINDQIQYWKEREEEIMKRRKVNKKELIDGNVGMIFEKTFAHREQMVGELDKKEEDEK